MQNLLNRLWRGSNNPQMKEPSAAEGKAQPITGQAGRVSSALQIEREWQETLTGDSRSLEDTLAGKGLDPLLSPAATAILKGIAGTFLLYCYGWLILILAVTWGGGE